MNNRTLAVGMAFLIAGVAWAAKAQESMPQPGDPQRWYQANITPQDRYRTATKEMAAALKEALVECRAPGAPDRGACERDAREQFRNDMALAKARLNAESSTRG